MLGFLTNSNSMELEIVEVKTRKELIEFIKFPFKLYKKNPYYVPPLIEFELSTLDREKNPAFETSDADYWIVKKKDEIVGRIAAIVLHEELKEKKLGRFGWVDFIDDINVSRLLIETASEWVKQKGAKAIHGPMGFTDLDFEGALIQGYDKLATQATIYNFPYYIDHYKELGLTIAATWVELRGKVPGKIPERMTRAVSLVKSKYNIRIKKFRNSKEILRYAPGVFQILNDSYSSLYGYYPLSQKQVEYYVSLYFGLIRKDFVSIVVDENDEVIGFGLTLPSLSHALQKAKGSLYPFGFIHVLKAFYFNSYVDMFLIGVKPEWQRKGAHALIFENLNRVYLQNKIRYVASGPMLENNNNVLNIWSQFDLGIGDIKRSAFKKLIVDE